jgi:hypothetical protein
VKMRHLVSALSAGRHVPAWVSRLARHAGPINTAGRSYRRPGSDPPPAGCPPRQEPQRHCILEMIV